MTVKYVDNLGVVCPPIRVYSQDAEPALAATSEIAIWIDTNDANRVYLIFRRGAADQVKIELT